MSKKDNIDLGKDIDLNIDDLFSDNEFNDDFNFDFEDERKPLSAENLKKAALEELKKAPSLDQISSALDQAVPSELNPEYNIIKDTISSTRDTITKNFTTLKKDMEPITKFMGKMNESYLNNNKYINKFIEFFKEEKDNFFSYQKSLEEDVATVLKETLSSQEDLQTKINSLNQILSDKRTSSTNDILRDLQKELTIIRTYTTDITSPFQRKSLELQYKSTYYLKEILESNHKSSNLQIEILKGIAKNTGLPDVVKQRDTEMLHAEMKEQIRARILDKFVNKNPLLTNIKKNVNNKITGIFNQARDRVNDAGFALEMGGDFDDIDKNKFIAQFGKTKALEILAKYDGNKAIDIPIVTKLGGRIKNFFDAPDQALKNAQESIEGESVFKDFLRSTLGTLSNLTKDPNRLTKNLITTRESLEAPTTLDIRTKLSINRIIPGYLRKIHAEVRAGRLGYQGQNTSSFEISYSHDQEKFILSSKIGNLLKKNIASHMKHNMDFSLHRLERKLKQSDANVSEDNIKEIAKYIALATTKTTASGLALLNSKELGRIIPNHLKTDFEKIKQASQNKYDTDLGFADELRSSTEYVRRSIPNVTKFFEEALKDGDYELLTKMGILEYDPLNNIFRPNEKNIIKTMFECYGIFDEESIKNAINTSDENTVNLSRFMKKNVIKGRKTYKDLKKSLKGDVNAQDKLKKEAQTAINNIITSTESMLNNTHEKIINFKNFNTNVNIKNKSNEDLNINTKNIQKDNLKKMKQEFEDMFSNKSNASKQNVRTSTFQPEDEIPFENIRELEQELRNKEIEIKAVKLIESASETSNNEAIIEVEKILQNKNLNNNPIIIKKLDQAKNIIKNKEKLGEDLLKEASNIKDIETRNMSLMGLLKTGLGIIPYGKTIKTIGKGLWWLFKRGWKNELWLAKNVYWPTLKGIGKLPFLGIKGAGALGKFGVKKGFSIGKNLTEHSVNFLRGVGNTIFHPRERNPYKNNYTSGGGEKKFNLQIDPNPKEKIINGMTESEFKKKSKPRKKKESLLSKLFGVLTKIGTGILGAITGLGGKILSFGKSIPALATALGSIGGKIGSLFKSSNLDIPTNPLEKGPKNNNIKNNHPNKKQGFLSKIKNAIIRIKDKLIGPISKKVGPKAALRVVGKLGGKLLGFITPGLGWISLAASAGGIAYAVSKGTDINSAICSELLGFDPWNDSDPVLDENGNPVKPDPEDMTNTEIKKEEQKIEDQASKMVQSSETGKETIPNQIYKEENKRQHTSTLTNQNRSRDPKNIEEFLKVGILPASADELKNWSDNDVADLRKEENFQLRVKKSSMGEYTLSEEERARQILLQKKKLENQWKSGENLLLVKLGREVDKELNKLINEKSQQWNNQFNTSSKLDVPQTKVQSGNNIQQNKSTPPPNINVNVDTDGIIKSQLTSSDKITEELKKSNELLMTLIKEFAKSNQQTTPAVSYTPTPQFNMDRNLSR